MGTLILNAYSAERNGPFVSIALLIGGEPPFPSRRVEVKGIAEVAAAFAAYKTEAAATGKPLALSIMMKRGDRSPPGFKALKAARLHETVNLGE